MAVSNDAMVSDRCRSSSYVQINDLSKEGDDNKDKQDIEEPLFELVGVCARYLSDNGGSETLCGDNTQTSDETADANVDEHGLLSPARSHPESSKGSGENDDACV